MAAQNLSQTNPFFFFFGGRTTTGHIFAPGTKNEKNSEKICKNEASIVGFFRNFDFSKNFNFNRKNRFWNQFFLLKLKPFFEKSKFRKNPTMLTSLLYIFSETFSFFVLGAKLRPVVVRPAKKNGLVCERFCAVILFSKMESSTIFKLCLKIFTGVYRFHRIFYFLFIFFI